MSSSSLVQYPGQGCVVEFMHGNKAQQAWVLEENSGKLRLLTINNRETKLAASRVLPWAGPIYSGERSRQEMAEILEKHRQKREEQQNAVDPMELWELAQGEVEKASVEWFAELLWEDPSIDDIAALGNALLACKTHFRFQPPTFEIFTAEKVEQRLVEKTRQEERERLVGAGQGFFRALWDAYGKGKPVEEQPDPAVEKSLRSIIMRRMADPDDHDLDQVWKLLAKGLPEDPHLALKLAKAWGIVPEHYNFWFDRAGYDPTGNWESAHEQAVAELKQTVAEAKQEPETVPYISIDSASTRDIDDAFHIERRGDGGYRLRIALACPAFCWPFGSDLDRDVLRRATSVYLPEGTYDMMPCGLGTDFYSLLAGEARPSMILDTELDREGNLERCTPVARWVRLAANLTYPDCEALLPEAQERIAEDDFGFTEPKDESTSSAADNSDVQASENNPAAAYSDQLLIAMELADKLMDRRIENGAVCIERYDPKVELSGEGAETQVQILPAEDISRSMKLVSEMMILANSGVALWAKENGVTLLHRTQDVAVPKEYAGVWSEPHDIARVVKALSSAVLETSPRPHRGIGVDAYSPITSPLRRYPDLVNVAQVIHYLATGEARWGKDDVEAMLPLLSARLDAAGQIQRFRPRYWKLQYFKQQGDKEWHEAIVTDENDAFVTVSLPVQQVFVRGRRQTFGDKVNPGQRFMVRIGKVHPLNNEIQILDAMEE